MNIQNHISYLQGEKLEGRKAGTEGEKLADEYIVKQFSKYGLKPHGEKEWYQVFDIYDGKTIKPSTKLKLNEDELVLYRDYFPLAFSANKSTEAAVAIALAENGVPWFKDIKELISNDDDSAAKADTFAIIHEKAIHAAGKGASALIIYNKSGDADIGYNRFDRSASVNIPVIYIAKDAFKKYATDESAIIDVNLNVDLEEKSRTGRNVIGYADNGADSTIITSAHLDEEAGVAALIEVARVLKANKLKSRNYLFVAYCGENNGSSGADYFNHHPSISLASVNETVKLDSLSKVTEPPKGLNLVKRSIEIIKNN